MNYKKKYLAEGVYFYFQKDVGGPLVQKNTVIGIASHVNSNTIIFVKPEIIKLYTLQAMCFLQNNYDMYTLLV